MMTRRPFPQWVPVGPYHSRLEWPIDSIPAPDGVGKRDRQASRRLQDHARRAAGAGFNSDAPRRRSHAPSKAASGRGTVSPVPKRESCVPQPNSRGDVTLSPASPRASLFHARRETLLSSLRASVLLARYGDA